MYSVGGSGPSKEREQKVDFYEVLQFPSLNSKVWLRLLERRRSGLPLP